MRRSIAGCASPITATILPSWPAGSATRPPKPSCRGSNGPTIRCSWRSRTAASLASAASPTPARSPQLRLAGREIPRCQPSRAGALEARAVERGNVRCTLASTTARRFYQAAGYIEAGPPSGKFGIESGIRCRRPWRRRIPDTCTCGRIGVRRLRPPARLGPHRFGISTIDIKIYSR